MTASVRHSRGLDVEESSSPAWRSHAPTPYYNLAASIEVARRIYRHSGETCDRRALAALLGYSRVKNGAFLTRVAAAKMFGLLDEREGRISLSDRGRATVASATVVGGLQARIEAFLKVEVFRLVFQTYRGRALPSNAALMRLLKSRFKVIGTRVGRTVRVLLQSAAHAGLLSRGAGRIRLSFPESAERVRWRAVPARLRVGPSGSLGPSSFPS